MPMIDEMERVPHHLVDQYSPSQPISTGEYCTKAADVIKDILSRNKVEAILIDDNNAKYHNQIHLKNFNK